MGKDCQGAGSIKGQTADCRGINVLLGKYAVDGSADAAPDVVSGLFLDALLAESLGKVLGWRTDIVALLRLP